MIITGVLELASKYRYGMTSRGAPIYLFVPYSKEIPNLIVGSSERDTSRNQIAIVDVAVDDLKHLGRGQLRALLGPVGEYEAEKKGLIAHYIGIQRSHKKIESFEIDTSHDAERIEISKETGWTVFTVDPPGCRDADDAIAFNREKRMMAISIADVASVVAVDSPINHRARDLGATFYDLDGMVITPMLPPEISEEIASLVVGERRRALTLLIHIQDDDGAGAQYIAHSSFQPSWITVEHNFTYESFATSPLYAEVQTQCPEEYKDIEDTHKWIEALMVLYNRQAANVLKTTGAGILRVQKDVDVDVGESALSAIDFRLVTEPGCYEAVSQEVGAPPQEHATLGGLYCHASSPLRRYVDLVNQRILLGAPSHSSDVAEVNERAKNNKRWTRDLQFLTFVTPGRIHTLDVVALSLDGQKVWVPAWGRRLTLRHRETDKPLGTHFKIQIFCDPTKRCWKERILTSPCSE